MFKLISAALFSLIVAVLPAHAAPSKAVFRGEFDGIAILETVTGTRLFYSPVRFKIDQSGRITGTAYNTNKQKLLKVNGSIRKVESLFGVRFLGTATGKFSDGTKWTAEVEANKGISAKIISGKARKGGYSGSLSLTNL